MLDHPVLTIVTPSFNQGQFLEQTICSVLGQDYANLEYIIIDGGSTDNSVDIIRKYSNHLTFWKSERDKGQSDAINQGFRRATGDILAYINSDDIYLPGTFQIVADYFRLHLDIDCVYGDLMVIDGTGKELFIKKAIGYDYHTALYSGCLVPQPACFFRRQVFEQLGEMDISLNYSMDYEWFVRFGHAGVHFGMICQPLAGFRFHIASKTQERTELLREMSSVTARYGIKPFYNQKGNEYLYRVFRLLYRLRIYLIRIVTRGDLTPFRDALTRLHGQY